MKAQTAQRNILVALASGPRSAAELRSALGNVSRATLSRLINGLGEQVVTLGQSRATQYACPRDIRGAGSLFPVYRIDHEGNAHTFGALRSIVGGFLWQPAGAREQIFRYLPWFIQDMRPDGFMGRAYALRNSSLLGLPPRLPDWSDDHVLVALARRGEDVIGDLIVGTESLERYIESSRIPPVLNSANEYPRLVEAALAGDPAGSSAAGEQPKFHALIEQDRHVVHVMVKFSPLLSTAEGERWGDLLVCEHIALETMAQAGIPAVKSTIITRADRTYLQVERFDRSGHFGRLPVHSLGGIDDEFFGHRDSWVAMAGRMEKAGMLSVEDAERLIWLDVFGAAIGNTDRHFGNVSVVPVNGQRTAFVLAPAYDMLPMFYRPRQGEQLSSAPYVPVPVISTRADIVRSAETAARDFWSRAAGDTRLTAGFREICAGNLEHAERAMQGPRLVR